MDKDDSIFQRVFNRVWSRFDVSIRLKLLVTFIVVMVIPLLLLTVLALQQFSQLGDSLRDISVNDAVTALNDIAIENIERMTTDTAGHVANFLYARDRDILYLATLEPTEENYQRFCAANTGRIMQQGSWQISLDLRLWIPSARPLPPMGGGKSSNAENEERDGFHYRYPETFTYKDVPLFDEVTFVDLEGNELVKVVCSDSTKKNYPLNSALRNVSQKENTYVKAEDYFAEVSKLTPGEIYVSDVIGAYVGTNYIGMYTPGVMLNDVAAAHPNIELLHETAKLPSDDFLAAASQQAFAGMENPVGQRFEGIVRWATPVCDAEGTVIGYATFALNHDHIMEFVDHNTPMEKRYSELSNAYEGNYSFIWDYKCRSICHPRHHSIVGYDPITGEPQIPWLETSIYEAWQGSNIAKWNEFISDWPTFHEQSRTKAPAANLTKAGLVGLDGRYLNNAPQCIGWMDLTADGGSGSFWIVWSGLYKMTTAAAIPYYTGQYAPSEANGFSKRGFGFVAIGAGLDDFTHPAVEMEENLVLAIGESSSDTITKLVGIAFIIILLIALIAVGLSAFITENITALIKGISRFRSGERQFRFFAAVKDEFGTLADSFDDMADSVVASVNTPLCITDMQMRIIYMNQEGLDFRKAILSDVVGTSYFADSIYPPESIYCPIKALHEDREAEAYYVTARNAYLRGTASYFLDAKGERIGYIILSSDVTEMTRERMKIEEQRTLLDRIFTASPDLIWYKDASDRYLAVNPRFSSIIGAFEEDFIGKTTEEIFPAAIAEMILQNDTEAMLRNTPLHTEERIAFADGHVEILDAVRTPINDVNGSVVGILGYARDISTRVTMEEALRHTQNDLEQAVHDAERASEHKGEFLARMSHEIRTPMNAIIGMTSIVQNKLGHPQGENNLLEIKQHMRQIETSSQHLLGLLDDILDISKIEAGKIDLTEEVVDIQKLGNTVASIIKPRCDEKKITFGVFFGLQERTTYLSDSLRLRQVLINLLGNAVKFTPEMGRVEFHITELRHEETRSLIEFSVSDTGIGIAQDRLQTIFESFEQGGKNITRSFGGTGLGLAISRRIVQLLGGDISVESTLGEGSTFSFTIWLEETESDVQQETSFEDIANRFANRRVLLVDDVEINRVVASSLLEMTGVSIDEAEDGDVAVELFAASEENSYDIILMDVQMPRMDGYQASSAIRALQRSDAQSVPIIALTANAFKDDILIALQHGMNAHVSKPIEMDKLLEVLFRYLG